jgi:hypothetical protein
MSTRDPESMTSEERQQEVAAIFTRGLLRRIQSTTPADSTASKKDTEVSPDALDLPAKTRLSVAPRPAG